MFDEELERIVLYYIIFEQEELELEIDDFINLKNQKIYKAINTLKNKKKEINIKSICQEIGKNEADIVEYISQMQDETYKYKCSVDYAFNKIKELTKKRKTFNLIQKMQEEIKNVDEIELYIEKNIKELNQINSRGQQEKSFLDMVVDTTNIIEQKMKNEYDYKLYTGFMDLDKVTNGLHEEELTVIGARPGVGKTTFALQIAEKIAKNGLKVAIVSLEMSENQIIQKIISRRAGVDSNKIRKGSLNDIEAQKVTVSAMEIADLPITITTKTRTIEQIEIFARKLKNKENLGLLIIDYIQLIKSKNKFNSREQEVAEITRTLKLLSLELKIPVIGLCQLNRNASRNEPTLADLRESGAIEQDADNVIFLYREKETENDEELTSENIIVDLQKQRAGGLTRVTLKFVKTFSEFRNLVRR